MTGNEVQIAFEILLEEIEAAGNAVIRHGSQALEQKRFDEARQAIELGVRIEEFRRPSEGGQKEPYQLLYPACTPYEGARSILQGSLLRDPRLLSPKIGLYFPSI